MSNELSDRDIELFQNKFDVVGHRLFDLFELIVRTIVIARDTTKRIEKDIPPRLSTSEMIEFREELVCRTTETLELFRTAIAGSDQTGGQSVLPWKLFESAAEAPPHTVGDSAFTFYAIIELGKRLLNVGWDTEGIPSDWQILKQVCLPSETATAAQKISDPNRWDALYPNCPRLDTSGTADAFRASLRRERTKARSEFILTMKQLKIGQQKAPPDYRFTELRLFAHAKLKKQQRAVIEALCDAGGQLTLADVTLLLEWRKPIDSAWNSLRSRINKKIKSHGWIIETNNRAARLTKLDTE